MKRPVIAIDGPAGAGKSTLGRMLAQRLGFAFLDTGAMYRAVAWKARECGVPEDDDRALARMLAATSFKLKAHPAAGMAIILDGREVGEEIRTPEVSLAASAVSARAAVREFLTALQQEFGAAGGVVAEGRDAGTVIFPRAEYKFYLDASPRERALRRRLELNAKGQDKPLAEILEENEKRDRDDQARALAPLRRSPDAIYLDTTGMDIPGVLDAILKHLARSETGAPLLRSR